MFNYTKAFLKKTKNDLDTALTVFQFGTQILYIAYLIYLLSTLSNIWYLHLTLLVISTAFLVFDLITTNNIRSIRTSRFSIFGIWHRQEKIYRAKRKRNSIRKIKFCTSHVIKLLVLSSALYPIIAHPYSVHPFSIVCTTVMALVWILQIVFEVLRVMLEGKFDLFLEALHADGEIISKPVNAVKNTFRKFMGKDIEDAPEPTKERKYLDELVENDKSAKTEKKREAKKSKKLSDWFNNHMHKDNHTENNNEEETSLVVLSSDTDIIG